MKTIFVFTPNSLKLTETGYLQGFYEDTQDWEAYYITNNTIAKSDDEFLVGFIKEGGCSNPKFALNYHLSTGTFLINSLNKSYVQIVYDYQAFKQSDVLDFKNNEHGPQFRKLMEKLKVDHVVNDNHNIFNYLILNVIAILDLLLKLINKTARFTQFSATISHFKQSLIIFKWFLNELRKDKKLTTKTRNYLISKLVDLVIGIILLVFFLKNKYKVLKFVEDIRETTIDNLKELLEYLRGSPIGLKLNDSFSNCLGKFFFYNIFLWRVFLHQTHPYLIQYFEVIVFPAVFGFSYQIAMFSDIISFATFHVYCIYVYAASLISFQLRAILSLFRLFIGRKFNPLRNKVDSCHYSQDQLFIGTLGFTILLFLLPTTALYYTVFTIFKVIISIIKNLLFKLRNLLNNLPVYVVILWIFRSRNVSGNLFLKLLEMDDNAVIVEAQLNTLPLKDSIKKFIPEHMEKTTEINWSKLIYDILTGVLI